MLFILYIRRIKNINVLYTIVGNKLKKTHTNKNNFKIVDKHRIEFENAFINK